LENCSVFRSFFRYFLLSFLFWPMNGLAYADLRSTYCRVAVEVAPEIPQYLKSELLFANIDYQGCSPPLDLENMRGYLNQFKENCDRSDRLLEDGIAILTDFRDDYCVMPLVVDCILSQGELYQMETTCEILLGEGSMINVLMRRLESSRSVRSEFDLDRRWRLCTFGGRCN
jgi:hypothetical protein